MRVAGQLFRVDEDMLAAMDALERVGEPDGYRRKLLRLEGADSSRVVLAYAYLKDPRELELSQIRAGPLGAYTHEHARLYRPRARTERREGLRHDAQRIHAPRGETS